MYEKTLNVEELAELRSTLYLSKVIDGRISFITEFMRGAYDQITSVKIVREV